MATRAFVGLDVSKHQLDVAFGPSGERMAVANDDRGVTRLVKLIGRSRPERIVLEASGGFEKLLQQRPGEKGLPFAVVNPHNVREFARASGRLAKTDTQTSSRGQRR